MVVELRYKLLIVALMVAVLLVACGSDRTTQAEFSDIDPGPAMSQAVAQLSALESASFTLDHLEGSTILVPGVLMTKVSGEVSIPGRFSVTIEAESEFPKSYIEISIITIDDTAYMTNILSGRWNQISADSLPFNLSGLGQTLADIVEAVQGPMVIGEERRGDLDTLYIKGEIASEDLSELVPGAGQGFPVQLELWLDQSQGLLQQVHIIGRVVPTDETNTVRQLILEDINQPVVIEPPDDN
ncbi:MAG TPA: LppX_LprAFG lipoprotein [Dehalococcoidia bacterium]|nr:LppX_LprAFG lipoprotein [Dehalococcoidia bacterium]